MRVLMPERILDRNVGGNTTYARNIARGLFERGVEVGRIKAGRHPLHTAALETRAAIKAPAKDQILHFVADTGPLLPARSPSVVTVHGVASRWISTARTPRQEFAWRQRVASAIANTQKIITVSNSSADDISTVFSVPRDRISVIHHGIDTELFSGEAHLAEEIVEKLPREFALYLGNVEPRKNLIELVKAVDQLAESSSAIPLVIAGRPAWNYQESMAAIHGSANVIYLGFVTDDGRRALMQKCKFFVFPSLYEGFGFPILEAMAAGAPVLSTDKGSLAEVRGPARLIAETNAEGIAAAMDSALADSQWLDDAAGVGRDWAARFSWDKSVETHINVYRELLK